MGKKSLAFPLFLWTCLGPALCSAEGSTHRTPVSLRLYSHELHLPGGDPALQCPVVQMHLGHVARHSHGARVLEEGAPVVFVTSLQRPLPVPGGGQAARQEGSEGGPLALAGGSSHYVWGSLGTSRATVWPECLVQLGCGPCLRPVCGQGWAR